MPIINELKRKEKYNDVRKFKKKEIGYIIGILVLIILLIFPIKISDRINSEAKIKPAREWILQKSEDGSIRISDTDHRKNIIHNVSTYQVERGDFIEFKMNETLAYRENISLFDTVGIVKSVETDRELAKLMRNLASAESYLQMSKTGEKTAVINMARERVNQANIQLENQKKIVERKKKLFENNLISEEEYEINKNTATLYELELLEAQANLTDIQTGSKPEEIALYQNEVLTTRMEIQRINDLMEKFVIRSPIDGWLYKVYSYDTLLIIGDTLSVAIMPIHVNDISKVHIGQIFTINADIDGTGILPTGKIININKMTEYLNQKPTIIVTGLVEKPMPSVAINSVLSCSIETESIILRDYVFNFIKSIFR